MERTSHLFVALSMALGGVLLGVLLTGCSHMNRIPAAEFKRQADSNNIQSFYSYEYIGQADGKAYLLRKRAPFIGRQWREDILFTPVAELGPEFMPRLEEMKK